MTKLQKKIYKYNQQYYQTHREERKKYNIFHQEDLKKYAKEYYHLHQEEAKKYRQQHKSKYLKYIKMKRKTDINFKIRDCLRCRFRAALNGISKSKSILKLIGCSIDYLKQHLESNFKKGMSWTNYGYYGWHIDHIKPCVSFDLSKESEQKKCFNWKNLQPLWAEDNWSKNCKVL
jgi:hypothetical protein